MMVAVRGVCVAFVFVGLSICAAQHAVAQAPLFLVDDETTVRSIAFQFDSTQTFEESQLQEQIATTAPGFIERVQRILPFTAPAPHPFSALELQRDVARLRTFYHNNGFLQARIGYAPSRLDTTRNTIRIVFAISEGSPIRTRTVDFVRADGGVFPDSGLARSFRKAVTVREGDRYSLYERMRTRDQIVAWLNEHGYAFARVRDSVQVDSVALHADLRFTVDPGPLAYFDDVEVEGHESVSRRVIVRELPFQQGERYSSKKLTQGQRELFALNLFRIALTDLPAQPRDSTVRVLVRVREARSQLVTYQGGYGRESGLSLQGDYTHRNFSGAARTLTTSLVANSGLGAAPAGNRPPARLFHGSVALRQPYLLTTQLSATVAPFVRYERDQQLEESDQPLGINTRAFGLTSTLLYEVLPFRTVSLQHTFSRVQFFTQRSAGTGVDAPFNRSILTLSGTFGRSNDYINPTHGVMVRPTLEMAGRVFGSGVQYYKASTEVTAYSPLSRRTGIAGRIFVGRLWPVGESRSQNDRVVENRFDPIRFYTGGGSDLRGWADRLAGPKIVRLDRVSQDTLFSYEAVGGLAKQGANVEVHLPFPGLGPKWSTGVFAEAGRVSKGNFTLRGFRYGTGMGVRYQTPAGFIRLDLAYKINPDAKDLRDPEAYYRYGTAAETDWRRRFTVHLSIGQAF